MGFVGYGGGCGLWRFSVMVEVLGCGGGCSLFFGFCGCGCGLIGSRS